MVRIRRQHSNDLKNVIIKYGFPYAPYHECSDVLYDLVGHEVDPVPIPNFDDEDDINVKEALNDLAEAQETNLIVICTAVGVASVLIIVILGYCCCIKTNIVTVLSFARRVTGG